MPTDDLNPTPATILSANIDALRDDVKRLRCERDLFKEAISAISHPIYAIDAQSYKILLSNPASIALYGDLSEHPFCYSWTHGRTTPCSGEEHPCPLKIIKKTKKPVSLEHIHFDKAGQPRFYQIHAYPIFDTKGNVSKIIEYSMEITKLRRTEDAHRESEQRNREIIAALNVAQEVQQSLLPQQALKAKNTDIAGGSLYRDETGGDYYDYIELPGLGPDVYAIVVGDVSGHGISSALLMASVRAYLRARAEQPGSVAEIITNVNQLVSNDTKKTSQFITLFILAIDDCTGQLTWVRAGHDPIFVYSPHAGCCGTLGGEGIPLGVQKDWTYKEYTAAAKAGEIMILATDGVWETRNKKGELFGRNRFKEVISQNANSKAESIRESIIEAVATFQGEASQEDDITLVVVKFL